MLKNRAFWLVCCAFAAFTAGCSDDSNGGVMCGAMQCSPDQICLNNACINTCPLEGMTQCSDQLVRICNNGIWMINEVCANGCLSGACIQDTPTTCVQGARQCAGSTIQTCTNGTWMNGEVCPNGCSAGACIPAGLPACTEGAKQCSGNLLMTCQGGNWMTEMCANGCLNNQCQGNSDDPVDPPVDDPVDPPVDDPVDPPVTGASCYTNDDCGNNEKCTNGTCYCGTVVCPGRDKDISYCSITEKCQFYDSYCMKNDDCESGEECNAATNRCIMACADNEPEGNIVPNWSFEEWSNDRPTFWSHHDNYQMTTSIIQSDDAHACHSAVQLINTTNNNGRLESDMVALPESNLHPDKGNKEKYHCSLWGAGEGTLNIGYITYDADGKQLSKNMTAGTHDFISSIYRELSQVEIKLETNARYIQFMLGFNETADEGITVDAFSCVRQANACDDKECAEWEACTTANYGQCLPLSGRCSTNKDCSSWAECDPETHVCVGVDGKCATSADCEGAAEGKQMCNDQHVCVAGDPCANVDCKKDWLTCKAGACVLKEGRCWNTEDCTEKNKPACYGATHTCVDISTTYKVENATQCRVTGYNRETKECPVNIVPNGGFEAWEEVQLGSSASSIFTLPVSWYGTEFEVDYERFATEIDAKAIKPYTTNVHSGNTALQIVYTQAVAKRFTSEGFDVPGGSYDCYYWARGKGTVRIHSYSSRGEQEKSDFVTINTNDWVRHQFFIKNAATAMRLIFYVSQTDAGKDHVQIDDVVCTERVF